METVGVLSAIKGNRDGGECKTTSMPGVEFIGRFLRHLLPKGLRRIRRCGMWGNRVRTEKLTLARRLLHVKPVEPVDEASPTQREEHLTSRWIWINGGWRPSRVAVATSVHDLGGLGPSRAARADRIPPLRKSSPERETGQIADSLERRSAPTPGSQGEGPWSRTPR